MSLTQIKQALRVSSNPILSPLKKNEWEAEAVFNPSIIQDEQGTYHMLYRAISEDVEHHGHTLKLSTIGYASSKDGVEFFGRRQLIVPEYEWEKYGCEDPRVTKIDGKYYIFYTALANYPPSVDGIKVAVAISRDLKTIDEKHLVTHFNAKAMTMFPYRIAGQYVVMLSANTDKPPSKVAIAKFDKIEQLWSPGFWEQWYHRLNQYEIPLCRIDNDQVEVGAVPVRTDHGWLLVYAHIQNYYTEDKRIFGVEAALLDLNNPQEIVARTSTPFMIPEKKYELEGMIPNVIFPTSALLKEDQLLVYYGATDNYCALARLSLTELMDHMLDNPFKQTFYLTKYHQNPIMIPRTENFWEANSVFNPAAIYIDGKFCVVYRAQSPDNTSTMGLAESTDGFHFERLHEPIYVPRKPFEQKAEPGRLSGCEDPRITRLDDEFYMFYTAYDGIRPPRVAISSILVDDFVRHNWQWSEPKVISSPEVDNKNSCLFPEKVNGKYVILHRVAGHDIAIDFFDDLAELQQENVWLEKEKEISPRRGFWDGAKIGIAGPPMKVDQGWLLLYHGVSDIDHHYRVGFMLLDKDNPANVLYRSPYPILRPTEEWERIGDVDNVVFPCGVVIVNGTIFAYYGGADKVVCVATAQIDELLAQIRL